MKIKYTLIILMLIFSHHAVSQKLLEKINSLSDKLPSLEKLFSGEDPLTTSLKGAIFEVPTMDNFKPEHILPATELPRFEDGSFFMAPGVWEFDLESYCLQAGTYGPSRSNGHGHAYAPLEGPKADIIRSILINAFKHPDISQRDIQVLLWGIIARQNIKDMQPKYMLIAARLIDPKSILRLNDGVIRKIAKDQFDRLLEKTPTAVREVLEAENKMRGMLTNVNTRYEDLERIAVLTGIIPENNGRKIVEGRWSSTPMGYFIRYAPSTYSQMKLQVYVPENAFMQTAYIPVNNNNSKSSLLSDLTLPYRALKQFNPSDHPAVPPSRGQRLGSSNRKTSDPDKRDDALDRANRILKFKSDAETGYGIATDPVGTILGKINPFTPDNMFDNILEFITDNGRKISDALNGDPPDPNYAELVKPEEFNISKINIDKFENADLNKMSVDFLRSYLHSFSLMRALVKSNDKQGGAALAKDKFWSNQHAWAIMYYKKKLGLSLLETCEKWRVYLDGLKSTYGSIPLKPQNVIQYQEQLKKNGFTQAERSAFEFMGLTEKEIAEIKTKRLSFEPRQFQGDYIEKSIGLMEAWKVIGERYAKFPVLPAPWE